MKISRSAVIALAFAGTSTLLCGLVYLTVQQSLRSGANDPQIQMAEDAAAQIAESPLSIETLSLANSGSQSVDIGQSLAPFLIVYDSTGTPTVSNGMLNSVIPTLPSGVLAYVDSKGEDRFTWQPQNDVRIAAVVVKASGPTPDYVLAGRSLREVEKREDSALHASIIIWIACLLLSGLLYLLI